MLALVAVPILSILLLATSRSALAQSPTVLSYLDAPVLAWSMPTDSRVETEVALSPAGSFVVVAGNDCTMTAFNLDGTRKWKYTPSDGAADCSGGILFGTSAAGVSYAARVAPSGLDSQIVAVSTADGATIVYSVGPIPGAVAGTPRITEDQLHLVVTSNSAQNTLGHFTVWNLADATSPLYQYDAPMNSTEPQPFGPIGFYWSPIQGYYDGGFDNSNDIFIWGTDNELSDPAAGIGQVYAFQFPEDVVDGLNTTFMSAPSVTLVGAPRGFQSPTAPVLANEGLSMYWTGSRNEVRCWIGERNVARNSFDKRPVAFTDLPKDVGNRGDAGMAPPVVTENAVFGPLAANQIFRVDPLCQESSMRVITTNASVTTKILPSLDEAFIFFATVEPDAKLYMMNASSLESVWEFQLNRGVEADMALSPDGTTVFVASAGGVVEAVTVARIGAAPTGAPALAAPGPTLTPTGSAKPSATPMPTPNTTDAPTKAPMAFLSTESPVSSTGGGLKPGPAPPSGPTTPASSGFTTSIMAAVVLQVAALLWRM